MKSLLRKLVRSTGYDISKYSAFNNAPVQLANSLAHFGIDLVFDVGANTGQFGGELRDASFKGRIVSFEPLQHAFELLRERAAGDSLWQVHPRCAIGDFDGDVEINVAANSVSSSVLPMHETHVRIAAESAYVGKEKVAIHRLDSIAPKHVDGSRGYFLKIDTQGYEWNVLDGARETLRGAQGILCELSLVRLYEGQRLWLEMIERLASEGMSVWAIQKGFTDMDSGQSLQVDALFFRRR
jgi:FkbM family methyltransferase